MASTLASSVQYMKTVQYQMTFVLEYKLFASFCSPPSARTPLSSVSSGVTGAHPDPAVDVGRTKYLQWTLRHWDQLF